MLNDAPFLAGHSTEDSGNREDCVVSRSFLIHGIPAALLIVNYKQ